MSRFASEVEALRFVHGKLVEQGYRCVDIEGVCVYDNGKGGHCAIGMLIDPSNEEALRSDASTVGRLVRDFPEVEADLYISGFRRRDLLDFWTAVQRTHDQKMWWEGEMFASGGGFDLFATRVGKNREIHAGTVAS